MAFNPTDAQRIAIQTRDRSVLLSAAAGSGKTATLTQRIIEAVTDRENPLDLSRVLVSTFTRAAAAELRERISAALTAALAEDPANPHLNRQSILIGSAEIGTIDSFCLNAVRANFQRLTLDDGSPLPPDAHPADEAQLATLRISVMNSVIDRWYEKKDDKYDFPRFVENFAGVSDEGNLVKTLIGYSQSLDNLPDPDGFTAAAARRLLDDSERDFFDTEAGKILREYAKSCFEYYLSFFESAASALSDGGAVEEKYLPSFAYDAEFCRGMLSALNGSYDEARAAIRLYSKIKLGSLSKAQKTEETEAYQKLRTVLTKEIEQLSEKLFSMPNEEIGEYSRLLARELETLSAVIADFRRELAREKGLRRILEFSDIKRLAHKLLVTSDGKPTSAALELRERYDAVYIDEYQDVDRVQDEIFSAVAKEGCRFVVGDIKQSIYRFRSADPTVFADLRRSMPVYGSPDAEKAEAGCSIFMSENFRCDPTVIEFVNCVSRHSLAAAKGIVGYRKEDDLIAAKRDAGNSPVTVAVLKDDELLFVASEIKKLLASGIKNDGTRIVGSDIAVLARGGEKLAELGERLAAEGIESSNESTKGFFEAPEILLVLSLVTAIDNPEKDIPLAAALRSPFFEFTIEELLRVRSQSEPSYSLYAAMEYYGNSEISDGLSEKCRAFVERLEDLRAEARELPVDAFVRKLYREFSVMSMVDEHRNARSVNANLRYFYEYARGFAASQSSGLSGFVDYINNIIESEAKVSTPTLSSDENSISLMTIHKSKGLEFPVVFVLGCGVRINKKDSQKPILFEPAAGVAMKLTDDTGFACVDPPQRTALAKRIDDNTVEEEMRVLYVALTRARERLYVTAHIGGDVETELGAVEFKKQFECRYTALSAGKLIDWILPAVVELGDRVNLVTELDGLQTADETAEKASIAEKATDEARVAELRQTLRERFDFVYPHATERLPAKLSVSRLYPEILDDDGAETLYSELEAIDPTRKPLFLQQTEKSRHSAAEKGTATHIFMQFCDLERAERSVREELSRLIEERFIPAGVAELVNVRQIERFFVSELYASLKKAKRVWREQRFNILLPAERFTADPELSTRLAGEELLVQGVIDLLFIDERGRIVLCDYKTDYLTPDETSDEAAAKKKLFDRHRQQLAYYCDAVEQLLGRRPDRVCLYSLPLGKAVEE